MKAEEDLELKRMFGEIHTLEDCCRPKGMTQWEYRNFLNSKAKQRVTAIDLFAGCGGFSCGMIEGGINVIWAIDNARWPCETYRRNLGNHIVEKSIYDVPSSEIPDCDIVFGSPPCQGFSLAGKRRYDDSRNSLMFEFIRVVRDKQPKFFVLENVPGLCLMGGYATKEDKKKKEGKYLKLVLQGFCDAGYLVKWSFLNAMHYGVPQNRKRIFIFGMKPGSGKRSDEETMAAWPPKQTHFSPEECEQDFCNRLAKEIERKMKEIDEQVRLDGKKERAKLLHLDFADFEKDGSVRVSVWKRHLLRTTARGEGIERRENIKRGG